MSTGILDFDVGNTRLKWRFTVSGKTMGEGAIAHREGLLERLQLDGREPDRIRIASVASARLVSQLSESCQARWGIEPEFARVSDHCVGVTQGYTDRTRLGVDRWLGLLAGHRMADRGCVVVSCGTAVTVDPATSAGEHLGGYIGPGIELMRSALFSGTSAVKIDKLRPPETLEPGKDTAAAVAGGLVIMVKGLVEQAALELRRLGDEPMVVVTGGDGELILPYLVEPFSSTNSAYRPNLVLDGLALALP